MSCRRCTEHPTEPLASYGAGNPAASLRAAARARAARTEDPAAAVHVHYDPHTDTFVILRTIAAAAVQLADTPRGDLRSAA